jgi:hypothetical protein
MRPWLANILIGISLNILKVELKYLNGEIHLSTDRAHVSEKFVDLFQLSPFITLGTSVYKPHTGTSS